jgi:outer membrane lipoprotein SlyB
MADALYDAILGVQPSKNAPPPIAPPKTSGVNQFNVGNLRPVGSSTGFQQPSSYEEGIKSMDDNLKVYGTKHKINTLRGVISRYAPLADKNDTEGYIKFVAEKTGLNPDQEIDLTNPAVRHVISGPMILMEKGGKAIFGSPAQQKTQAQPSSSEDPLYNAILGNKPKQPPVSEQDLQKALETPTENESVASTFNRQFARQGAKMREKGSKLEPFVQEVAKPLEGMSIKDWKDKSLIAPAVEYTASSLGIPGFTEEDKKAAQEKLIKKGKSFVDGVNQFLESPVQTTKQALNALAENPGKFVGESVKSVIYDPEQIYLGNVAGKAVGDVAGKTVGGAKKIAETVAETPAYQGLVNKAKSAAETMQEGFQAYKQAQAPQGTVVPAGASVGAAQTATKSIIDEAMTRATPELKQELSRLDPKEINIDVLNRHLDADTLPVPIKLSEGQATRDPNIFSQEMNNRGKNKEIANRYNEQNTQLVENIDAIKENASPNVYGTNVVENGQSLIDAYLDIDKARLTNIDAKYQALRDAAGGDFPIDGVKFADNALISLKKNLKTEFLPDSIMKQVKAFKRGEKMTFEQFEAMRTNLAAEMRKADIAGDGNAEFALGKVREALDDLPLVGETKELKALADIARAAAKERFDTLSSDKAYKAAVNGKVAPDDFIQKFVVNGKKGDIDTMVSHLGADSQAREVMASGIINWLKSKAGISKDGNGTFSQKGFNQALENIDPKILAIVGPEVNQQLKALGNTARNIQERPVGGFVNESNTWVGAIANKAAGGVELGLNLVGGGQYGIPIGTMARGAVRNAQEARKIKESLKPGAGLQLKDIGK